MRSLLRSVERKSKRHKVERTIVWTETPHPNFLISDMNPRKKLTNFGQFDVLNLWARIDQQVCADKKIARMPNYEHSLVYSGLQCDGFHFGSSFARAKWGCEGFSVVTDVLTQIWLGRVCHNAVIGMCNAG